MAPGLVRALLAWIYQTEVPAGLPASITGRRVDLWVHERTAEGTADDGVAAAVTGICNRWIRHAARYRQGTAARPGAGALEGMTMANLASSLVETASGLGDCVTLRAGPTATTDAELDRASSRVAGMLGERDHVMAQVAAYKYPRKVRTVNELPKGPTGKIVKREIVPPGDQGT
jgi:acyl-CoA synthetase (AMP-forming)/AMP-acid ligase II